MGFSRLYCCVICRCSHPWSMIKAYNMISHSVSCAVWCKVILGAIIFIILGNCLFKSASKKDEAASCTLAQKQEPSTEHQEPRAKCQSSKRLLMSKAVQGGCEKWLHSSCGDIKCSHFGGSRVPSWPHSFSKGILFFIMHCHQYCSSFLFLLIGIFPNYHFFHRHCPQMYHYHK